MVSHLADNLRVILIQPVWSLKNDPFLGYLEEKSKEKRGQSIGKSVCIALTLNSGVTAQSAALWCCLKVCHKSGLHNSWVLNHGSHSVFLQPEMQAITEWFRVYMQNFVPLYPNIFLTTESLQKDRQDQSVFHYAKSFSDNKIFE